MNGHAIDVKNARLFFSDNSTWEEITGSPKLEHIANSPDNEKYHVILRNCPFCGKSITECNIVHHPNGVYIECICGATAHWQEKLNTQ